MNGIRGPATLRNTCATAAGLLAAVHVNIPAISLLGGALLLISILALTAGLSRQKERRDAAYKVLKLILYTIRRPREPSVSQQIRPEPDLANDLRGREQMHASDSARITG
jgi:hypothetical protein